MKRTFCEVCRQDVEYYVRNTILIARLKNQIYQYNGKKAICSKCGNEVYVADIEDENLKSLYSVYQKNSKRKE